MKGLIIGFGNMGQLHLDRYKKLGAAITAVIDAEADKRQLAIEGGLDAYASLEEYMQSEACHDIDFVDICLPTDLHLAMIKKAVTAFAVRPIPICVEKPVVRTNEEAAELSVLSANYSSFIFVAECEHYNKRITDFLAAIENPTHIKISRMVNLEYFLKGARPWFLDASRSGGLILDLMIHDFSLLDSIGGQAILNNAKSKSLKFNCIDEATVELQFAKFTAEVTGSWLSNDIEHPIVTTIVITDKNNDNHKLIVDDYMSQHSRDDEDDPYLVELQAFLNGVQSRCLPHQLDEYLRVVRLANSAIALIENRQLSPRLRYFNSASGAKPDVVSCDIKQFKK